MKILTKSKLISNYKFTGNKNIDRVIALKLDGKDLLSFCSSSSYLNNLCNEEFFTNQIKKTSLEEIKEKYPFANYRRFYARMMYYIKLLKEKYNFKYDFGPGSSDPRNQYY